MRYPAPQKQRAPTIPGGTAGYHPVFAAGSEPLKVLHRSRGQSDQPVDCWVVGRSTKTEAGQVPWLERRQGYRAWLPSVRLTVLPSGISAAKSASGPSRKSGHFGGVDGVVFTDTPVQGQDSTPIPLTEALFCIKPASNVIEARETP